MRVPKPPACLLVLLLVSVTGGGCASMPAGNRHAPDSRPRVVVTTDPELDDSNSLVRYLLYSTDFRTEGLVYASSQFHWKGDGRGTKWFVAGREYTRFGLDLCPCESWRWAEGEKFIDDAVDTYARVYENLRVHHPHYPEPAELRSKIRVGNVEFDGDISRDSPGSDLIRSLLLDDGDEPLYLLAWGGQSTIARALKSIREQYGETAAWPELHRKVSRKAIIQAFGDQDGTYTSYIAPNWPGIEFREMATQAWGYGARSAVLPADQVYLGAQWTREFVSSRGPLGEFYRVWGDGKQMVEGDIFDYFGLAGRSSEELRSLGYVVWMPVQAPGSWISEGDTPTFLNLVSNGLRAHEDSTWSGWGGQVAGGDRPPGSDRIPAEVAFFGAAQRDFASRMHWSVTPSFSGANHPPVVRVRGPLTRQTEPGAPIRLEATVSDPDGDNVALRWWHSPEPGSYAGTVTLSDSTGLGTELLVPAEAPAGAVIHVIVEAYDDGVPPLSRYQRVLVEVAR